MQQLRASLALHHGRAISVTPRRRVSRSGPVVRRSVSRQEAVAEAAAAEEKLRAANFDPDAASVLTTVFPLWTVINKDIEAAVKPLATRDDITQAFSHLATRDDIAQAFSQVATRDDITQAFSHLATRDDIAQAFSQVVTRDDITQAFSQLVTKEDFKAELAKLTTEIRKLTDKLAENDNDKLAEDGQGTMAIGMAVSGVLGMVAVVVIDALLT
eukprot:XP_001703208.1 predicted protein [Chlamydomonas reinhardtii]